MLKTQLGSRKISQLTRDWRTLEDILTGDFFGVLDYLPREPYLRNFLEHVERLNDRVGCLDLSRANLREARMLFWTRRAGHEDMTEPDVVLVSDRWVIVVEVKLGSGHGENQPWREYRLGQDIAADHGLAQDAVHYLVLTRERMSEVQLCHGLALDQQVMLKACTLFIRWSQALAMIDGWLRDGVSGHVTTDSELRMLGDLHAVLRRRRTLWFAGFTFPHQRTVRQLPPPVFCPPRFTGFLRNAAPARTPQGNLFLRSFDGFLLRAIRTPSHLGTWLHHFTGFAHGTRPCAAASTMGNWITGEGSESR